MDSSMLKEATSSDDSPTPGFVLNEISRATIASYSSCTALQDFLLSRLTRNNHNTKLKCLVIIKHVCRAGRADFKREMSRNVEPIKACLQYTGPADPLRGDDIYRKVRDAAKEALGVLFDSQTPVTTSAVSASNRIQGIGGGDVPATTNNYLNTDISSFRLSAMGSIDSSSSYHSKNEINSTSNSSRVGYSSSSNGTYSGGNGNCNQGASNSSSSGKMEGFGNLNFNNDFSNISSGDISTDWIKAASKTVISASENISATIRTVANQITNESDVGYRINSSYANNMPPTNTYGKSFNNNNNNNNNSVSSSYTSQQPISSNFSIQNGGYNINSNNSGYNISNNSNINNLVPDIPQQTMGMGRAGGASSDGTYEKQLLESLCDSGGLKNTLNEEKLKSFLMIAPTLNTDVVGLCLLELLNHDIWQTRYKALIVIANLCQSSNRNNEASSSNQYLDWWLNHTDDIKGLLSDSKTSVRTQAIQTLKVLNIEGYSSSYNQQHHNNATSSRQPNNSTTSVMTTSNPTEFNFIPYNNDEINRNSQPSSATVQTTQPSIVITSTAVFLIDFDEDSPVTSISVNPITVNTISNNIATTVNQSDDDTTLFSGMVLTDNNSNSNFSTNNITLDIITPSRAQISSSSSPQNSSTTVDLLNQQDAVHENSDDFSSLASIVNFEITTVNATNLPNKIPPLISATTSAPTMPTTASTPFTSNAYESSADTIVKDGVDFLSSKTQINSAPSSSPSSSSHQAVLNQLSPQQHPSYHQQQPALFMHTNPPILSAPYYSTGGGGIAVLPTNMKYYQPRPYLLSSQSPSSPQGLRYCNGTMTNMNMPVPPQIFNSSVMHSTDLSKRKIIPDINSAESSGFLFGQQSQNKSNDDSFKFIADEIKQTANNTSTNGANKK